jgi:orotidine-5'-phosphate decarboxylase
LRSHSTSSYTTQDIMTPPFAQRFVALAAKRSPLCVGIDPSPESLADWGLSDDAAGLRAFCERLADVCGPIVAAIKPQAAFFERHGPAGMEVLRDTVARSKRYGALVIIDAKRGDIASTAVAYGEAFLGPQSPFGGDAITVNPYLGFAALAPIYAIARREAAGVFVVVRSSNVEENGLQQALMPDGLSVAEHLGRDIAGYNANVGDGELGPIGAVLGATLGGEAARLAALLSNGLLLVPGIGAQGATIADVRRDFAADYSRVVPSISRAICRAGPTPQGLRAKLEEFAALARGNR